MKPLHIGLLAVGAVLAGGLAFKMTQPPPIALVTPAIQPPPAPPPVERYAESKPSPMPAVPPSQPPPILRATAPDPVYDASPKTGVGRNEAKPVPSAARKNEPILTANLKPLQWVPGKYESPDRPVKAASAQPAAADSVVTAAPATSPAAPVVPAVEQRAAAAPLHHATLRTGMVIVIRLNEPLSGDYTPVGGTFAGSLAEPLIADGFIIAEQGAQVTGRILDSEKAGRFTGTSRLKLALTNVKTSDGQQVAISTEPWLRLGDSLPSDAVIAFRLKSRVTISEQPVH